jgi:hypothetical protein
MRDLIEVDMSFKEVRPGILNKDHHTVLLHYMFFSKILQAIEYEEPHNLSLFRMMDSITR